VTRFPEPELNSHPLGSGLPSALLESASAPYLVCGRYAYRFARGKFRHDPAFRAILEHGLLLGRRRILDLGCGQGLLAAWLQAAERCHAHGRWPQRWPPPPTGVSIRGLELRALDVERARRALGTGVEVLQADIRSAEFGSADAVIMLDVLHYLSAEAQRQVVRRVRAALPSGGLLLLRVGNPAGGIRFRFSQWTDRTVMLARGQGWMRLHCRSIAHWRGLLRECGFDSKAVRMSEGTPFANELLIAHAR